MAEAHTTKAAAGVEPRPLRLARHPVVLIAAVARNGVIGRDGGLPWDLPGDLAHFKRSSMGRPVVMGRRTFEETGQPLPGRPTIVLSADPAFAPPGVLPARDLDTAFAIADREAEACGAETVVVAGGTVVYAATIARADSLILTMIDAEPAGDTVFPPIDRRIWVETLSHVPVPHADDTLSYRITQWERRDTVRPGTGSLLGTDMAETA